MIATHKSINTPLSALTGAVLLLCAAAVWQWPTQARIVPSSVTQKSSLLKSSSSEGTATGIIAATAMQASPVLKQGLQPVFQPNLGQFDKAVRYAAMGNGYQAYLTRNQLSIVRAAGEQTVATTLNFVGANDDIQSSASDKGQQVHHYYSEAYSVENVPTYERVRYASLYDGIDAVFYSRQGQIEYDFKVQPQADPAQISLLFSGVEQARLDAQGDLLLTTPAGVLRQKAPVSYQLINQQRVPVDSRYRYEKNEAGWLVSFDLGHYRKDLPLVIDPVLDYGTYIGGIGNDSGNAVAVDSAGNVYVTGETGSSDFPFSAAATVSNIDVFVAKLIPDNKQFPASSQSVYITHLGGTGNDIAHAIDVDANNNVYIAGETSSFDLLSTNLQTTAYQSANNTVSGNNSKDAFVARLNANGTIIYASYFGGDGDEVAYGLAVDAAGSVYITGETNTDNADQNNPPPASRFFPIKAALFFETGGVAGNGGFFQYDGSIYQGGISEAFVARIDTDLVGQSGLIFSSYLGGNGPSCFTQGGAGVCTLANNTNTEREAGLDIALDSANRIYIVGATASNTAFPVTKGAYKIYCGTQSGIDSNGNPSGICDYNGSNEFSDAFVAVINAFDPVNDTRIQMNYASYIGGRGRDIGYGIATDANGSLVYIAGSTLSFPDPANNNPDPAYNKGGFPIVPFQGGVEVQITPGATNVPEVAFMSVIKPSVPGSGAADLKFSATLGTATSRDIGRDIALNTSASLAYIAGETDGQASVGVIQGYNLPAFALGVPQNPSAPTAPLGVDGFVASFDINAVAGNAVPFYTLIGGGGNAGVNGNVNDFAEDRINGIVLDAKDNIYLTGSTQSEYEYNSSTNQGSGFMITRAMDDTAGTITGTPSQPLLALQTKCGEPTVIASTGQTHICAPPSPPPSLGKSDAFLVKLAVEADLALAVVTPVNNADVFAGADSQYVFSITNNGPETARNVVLTATVTGTSTNAPAEPFSFTLTNINNNNGFGCSQPTGGAGDIVCTIADIPSGVTVTETFNGLVQASTVPDVNGSLGTVTLDANVATSSADTVSTNNMMQINDNIVAGQLFDAAIAMTADPSQFTVIAGAQTTFTVTVTNNGPNNSGGLIVNFPLTTQMDLISITPTNALAGGCTAATQGKGQNCTLAANIQNGQGLQVGESATWDIVFRPLVEGNSFSIGGVTLTETQGGSAQDTDSTNNSTTGLSNHKNAAGENLLLKVLPGADLDLTVKTANLGGNSFRYDLTMRNFGPSAAVNILLRTDLPKTLENPSSVQSPAGNCTVANHGSPAANATNGGVGFVECTFTDSGNGPVLASGGSFDWSITVDGAAGTGGLVPLTLNFTSDTADPNKANNTVTRSINLGGGSFTRGGGGGSLGFWSVWLLMLALFSAKMYRMSALRGGQ